MAQDQQSSVPDPRFKPISNICMALNGFHIYTDEAREGKTRAVKSQHYCSHISSDLRQCLIYDSNAPDARLIGVEYMIPKSRFLQLEYEEQKLWHSHHFEVTSGMLIHPAPPNTSATEWDKQEAEMMREVMELYGKTWHFWQIDRGDELPLGKPVLMGSLTEEGQMDEDLKRELKGRDEEFGADSGRKKEARGKVRVAEGKGEVEDRADAWWKEAKAKGKV